MSKTVRAVYRDGLFRPTQPVDLPDPCEVEFEILGVAEGPTPPGDGVPAQPSPPANWDNYFANPLAVGSAPADEGDDDAEVIGDDLLF